MKKIFLLIVIFSTCTIQVSAQNLGGLGSLLKGAVQNVVGDKLTSEQSILGTWVYTNPEVGFTSDNLLSQAGSEVASQKLEPQIESIYKLAGMETFTITFNEDGTCAMVVKGKTTNGKYTFNAEKKTITFKVGSKLNATANITTTLNEMKLTFESKKIMSVVQTIGNAAANLNSTASSLNTLLKNYDGVRIGMELKKK